METERELAAAELAAAEPAAAEPDAAEPAAAEPTRTPAELKAVWKDLKKNSATRDVIAAARKAYVLCCMKAKAASEGAACGGEQVADAAAAPDDQPRTSVYVRTNGKKLRTTVQAVVAFFEKGPGQPASVLNEYGESPSEGKISKVAIVSFGEEEQVEKALAMSGNELDGRAVIIGRHSRPPRKRKRAAGSCRVYVGNLPFDVSEEAITERFSECGDILFVRFASKEAKKTDVGPRLGSSKDKVSKGFCFVIFNDPDGDEGPARKALKLNRKRFRGREMTVAPAEKKERRW